MKVVKTIDEFINFRNDLSSNLKIGFVPTMGALHKGHISLIKKAKEESDIVIVSIFVNPTQFNDKKDLEKYPNTLDQDLKDCLTYGVDVVLNPDFGQLYPDDYKYKVIEDDFSNSLCGKARPGHFDGVLSVVMKLFNIVRPHKAFFGEKDYQQLQLIKGMVNAFFLNIEIVGCPIVREESGLALSSRNKLLTKSEQSIAPKFNAIISQKVSIDVMVSQLEDVGFKVDYLEERFNRRFGAVFLGNVRLIDNVEA